MFKDINTLLTENKTEEERKKELLNLLPNLSNGEKVYYSGDSYLLMDGDNLYNGMDKYPKNSIIKGRFPYVFLLSAVYNALKFAEDATKYESFNRDKKFKKTNDGFIYHPETGIIANHSLIKDLLKEFEEKESLDEKLVENAIKIAKAETSEIVEKVE